MPGKVDLPETLKRSPAHAQDIYAKTLASALETYGDERRAHMTAIAALKHSYEKVGDHWEEKSSRGPSDERAAASGDRGGEGESAGGVDANASKAHLLDVARRLEITGRSAMTKDELVEAIQQANARATRRSRQE